jgi:GrpB-like predicted nucleotidyltransferase (UPF0157 family)
MVRNVPRLSYYDFRWKNLFTIEKKILLALIPPKINSHINHIGSTAVDGLVARPIIDIVIGIENPLDIFTIKDILVFNKYTFFTQYSNLENLVFYKIGNDGNEYIIHLTKYNGETYQKMMKMVKILSENVKVAKQYADYKTQLINAKSDLKTYNQEKQNFIRQNLN